MASGPLATTPRWVPGDSITICDGSNCLTLKYQASGIWLPFGGTIRDDGRGYQNAGVSRIVGGSNDWNAVYQMLYGYLSYSTTVPYERVVTGSVTIVPATAASSGFGSTFSMGFNWGAASNSDAFLTSQGGTMVCNWGGCRNVNQYTMIKPPSGP